MINLATVYWMTVIFIALTAMMRGWTKEIIATSGLMLSMFIIYQFGFPISTKLGLVATNMTDPAQFDIRRRQFFLLGGMHLLIVFFSYQGPTLSGKLAGRLRVRDGFQDKFMAFIVGGINGYLIVGLIWSLLEYVLKAEYVERLQLDAPYPFDVSVIVRPEMDQSMEWLMGTLPLFLIGPYAPYLLVAAFLFVIIVII